MNDATFYIQHIDGDYFCGYREIYTPHKAWAPTWSKVPQIGRTLADAKEVLTDLNYNHGIGEVRIVTLTPVTKTPSILVAIAVNDKGDTMAECHAIFCKSGRWAIKLVPMHGYGKTIYCRKGMTEHMLRKLWQGKFDRIIHMI